MTPKATPWRAGQAKRHIGLCKHLLHRLIKGKALSGTFEDMEVMEDMEVHLHLRGMEEEVSPG